RRHPPFTGSRPNYQIRDGPGVTDAVLPGKRGGNAFTDSRVALIIDTNTRRSGFRNLVLIQLSRHPHFPQGRCIRSKHSDPYLTRACNLATMVSPRLNRLGSPAMVSGYNKGGLVAIFLLRLHPLPQVSNIFIRSL